MNEVLLMEGKGIPIAESLMVSLFFPQVLFWTIVAEHILFWESLPWILWTEVISGLCPNPEKRSSETSFF